MHMYIHTHKHCTYVLTTSFLSPNWKPFKSLRERRVHSGSEYSQKPKAITKYQPHNRYHHHRDIPCSFPVAFWTLFQPTIYPQR